MMMEEQPTLKEAQYAFYDTSNDWQRTPWLYRNIEDAKDFYLDVHRAFYYCYAVKILDQGNIVQELTFEDFMRTIEV